MSPRWNSITPCVFGLCCAPPQLSCILPACLSIFRSHSTCMWEEQRVTWKSMRQSLHCSRAEFRGNPRVRENFLLQSAAHIPPSRPRTPALHGVLAGCRKKKLCRWLTSSAGAFPAHFRPEEATFWSNAPWEMTTFLLSPFPFKLQMGIRDRNIHPIKII